jgi:hypothetical protein
LVAPLDVDEDEVVEAVDVEGVAVVEGLGILKYKN